jgi:hypothetical protein
LELWKVIKATHQILTTSKVASVIKKTAREEYAVCKQGAFEHIVDYKCRFDARLDALIVSGNAVPPKEDIAMDFMYGLDNTRYADFKAEIVSNMQKGALTTQIDDLNKMYILASRRVVVKTGDKSASGATFATVDNNMAKQPKDDKAKTKEQKYAESLVKMKCFNCGEKGHPAKSCPKKAKKENKEEDDDEPPMAGMTAACCATSKRQRLHDYFEVCLDNGSQVSIVDSRLLNNLRTDRRTYRSMNGIAHTDRIGYLEGFFECQACDNCPTNIISMARVEDIYPLTYSQGESMDDRDLVFKRRDGMYVADFSDWIVEDEERMKEVYTDLCLSTVEERESLYSRKQLRKALEAGEYLRALGYPSMNDAIHIVRDGNVRNIPYGVEDVRRFIDIYGAQIPALRGKTTKKHPNVSTMEDRAAKHQITRQTMVADVMNVCGEKFLVSISSPLEVLMVKHLQSKSKQCLGTGMQAHINTLRSRGFEPERVLVDPHRSLVALQGEFPGVEIDPCGAGDHLEKIDIKIRRLKELMRAVLADLPYSLPKDRLKDLVTYSVSRLNNRSTKALNDVTSLRIRLTGFKPDFKQEFGLAFGDYAEVFNPKASERSNDVTVPRTEPCVALYPSANQNGSWVFYNLDTKTYVQRTQWKKLPTNKLVIATMNELAGTSGLKAVYVGIPASTAEEVQMDSSNTHVPIALPPEMTNEEMAIDFDEALDLPELIGREDDEDSISESGETVDNENDSQDDDEDPEDRARFK